MTDDADPPYVLDDQVGFLLRRANQRHLALFARALPDLTPTQFAALAKLNELGGASQNALGRATAMDAATIKGVVDRLHARGLVSDERDPDDSRLRYLRPTPEGRALFASVLASARDITKDTLAPLSDEDARRFLRLLRKLG